SSNRSSEPEDEDERLLASEEGKKLSSKERRQLRNKVSARHFRLRRKEYITHLEQLVAQKSSESSTLKTENTRLADENKRLREALSALSLSPSSSHSAMSMPVSMTNSRSTSASSYLSPSSDHDADIGHVVPQQHQQHHPQALHHHLRVDSHVSQLAIQEPQQQQHITPRLVNLIPTFTRKDTNPNMVNWALDYDNSTGSQPSDNDTTNSCLPSSNMQVFNTLVPESLAELEKEALNAQDQTALPGAAEGDLQNMQTTDSTQTTITLNLISPKPDKEENGPSALRPQTQEGIWEDARKAAEEVYRRLGVHLAGLKLDDQ
ncbi:uncharacterized protein V1516DRAFT_606389, partial [Lipomyces oligophaga]|uniref:uncharacterized protein n=1 Tax=Lipomyces oligophaga TaxID=45792 RepID=UPI0034CF451C